MRVMLAHLLPNPRTLANVCEMHACTHTRASTYATILEYARTKCALEMISVDSVHN